ncbi:MAG: hypothetical protein D6692_07435 [Planctomycetota bacterium]|nr:MAG: hypothetical protein D6692_07435 [Planctomycetota bacterium]
MLAVSPLAWVGENARRACANTRKKSVGAAASEAARAGVLSRDEAQIGALLDDGVMPEPGPDGAAGVREGRTGCGMA